MDDLGMAASVSPVDEGSAAEPEPSEKSTADDEPAAASTTSTVVCKSVVGLFAGSFTLLLAVYVLWLKPGYKPVGDWHKITTALDEIVEKIGM